MKIRLTFLLVLIFSLKTITVFAEPVSERYVPDFLYDGFRKISKLKSIKKEWGPDWSGTYVSEYTQYEWIEGTIFESGVLQKKYNISNEYLANPHTTIFYSRGNNELRIHKKISPDENCEFIPFQLMYKYGMEIGDETISSYEAICNNLDSMVMKVNKKIKMVRLFQRYI